MPPKEIPDELVDQLLAGREGPEAITGPDGLLKQLTKRVVERAVSAELSGHLGYELGEEPPQDQPNRRNGLSSKTLIIKDQPRDIDRHTRRRPLTATRKYRQRRTDQPIRQTTQPRTDRSAGAGTAKRRLRPATDAHGRPSGARRRPVRPPRRRYRSGVVPTFSTGSSRRPPAAPRPERRSAAGADPETSISDTFSTPCQERRTCIQMVPHPDFDKGAQVVLLSPSRRISRRGSLQRRRPFRPTYYAALSCYVARCGTGQPPS
jgi:hypothetical protein